MKQAISHYEGVQLQKFLFSQPRTSVGQDGITIVDKLIIPCKVEIRYSLLDFNTKQFHDETKEVEISYLFPKCFADVHGWQKPYWTILGWKSL